MAAALVADTSSWIPYLNGRDAPLLDRALRERRVLLPPIVASELASGNYHRQELLWLQSLLSNVPLIATDLAHCIRTGRLRAALRAHGLNVTIADAHVAQCALDLDADLLTEDDVFRRIARHSRLRLAH